MLYGTTIVGDSVDCIQRMPSGSAHCCITSPPYYTMRDYGVDGQIGLEVTFWDHLAALVRVFSEVYRVLRDDGSLWLNYGDMFVKRVSSGGGNPSLK